MKINNLEIKSFSPKDTQSIGEIIGRNAKPGQIYLLTGNIGAGKTCLVQGILWGLDNPDYVRSPTFIIATEYTGKIPLFHIDLYRIDPPFSTEELGIDEYLYGNGITVIEWAEKAPHLFKDDHIHINIDISEEENQRNINFSYSSEIYASTINDLIILMNNNNKMDVHGTTNRYID